MWLIVHTDCALRNRVLTDIATRERAITSIIATRLL
jgi:hypothetical protein